MGEGDFWEKFQALLAWELRVERRGAGARESGDEGRREDKEGMGERFSVRRVRWVRRLRRSASGSAPTSCQSCRTTSKRSRPTWRETSSLKTRPSAAHSSLPTASGPITTRACRPLSRRLYSWSRCRSLATALPAPTQAHSPPTLILCLPCRTHRIDELTVPPLCTTTSPAYCRILRRRTLPSRTLSALNPFCTAPSPPNGSLLN